MGPFDFDSEKATEALLYVASRVRDSDMYTTLKVLYIADKCHLHRYGRFIFGDTHHALPYGPVPQGAYDIVKAVAGRSNAAAYVEALRSIRVQGNTLTALREPNEEVFSNSDIECLEEAIHHYGSLSFEELKALTHDEAFLATRRGGEIAVDAIAALAEHPVTLIQHLNDPHPDEE